MMRHSLLFPIVVGGAAVVGLATLADRLGWSEAAQGWSVMGLIVVICLIIFVIRDRTVYRDL